MIHSSHWSETFTLNGQLNMHVVKLTESKYYTQNLRTVQFCDILCQLGPFSLAWSHITTPLPYLVPLTSTRKARLWLERRLTMFLYQLEAEVCTSTVGEELNCWHERDNFKDFLKESLIVGHMPKKISSICPVFLQSSGTITCKVTGNWQYLADLDQGGLKVPCKLLFLL